jgi:phosphate-selective porin OprO/OprP
MKRNMYAVFALAAAGVLCAGPAYAGFVFGEETKGATIANGDSDINIRVRLQPRFDFGDLVSNGNSYDSQSDLFIRRARVELGGHLLAKEIQYSLVLTADKWEKIGNANEVGLLYAYVRWVASDAAVFTLGKEKLPYSRVSLSSSAKQLIIERPVSTEAAKKVFGATDAYYQPKFSVGGKLAEGIFGYEVAVADGWQNGEDIQATGSRKVQTASPLLVGRVELSPPGWTEKSKSDAHLGKGQHLTLGANVASQSGIKYQTGGFEEDRSLWGVDLSGHYKGFTAQFEYNEWDIDSTDPMIAAKKPKGWYAQAGYFIEGPNVEPVARYEVYDQDSNSANKEEKVTTLGVNWYGKGHSFKVGANWLHHEFEAGASGKLASDDSRDIYQVQAQLYY